MFLGPAQVLQDQFHRVMLSPVHATPGCVIAPDSALVPVVQEVAGSKHAGCS